MSNLPNTFPNVSESGEPNRIALDNTIGAYSVVSGFLTQKVGRKITLVQAALTDTYNYFEGETLLWVIVVTFATSAKKTIASVERAA